MTNILLGLQLGLMLEIIRLLGGFDISRLIDSLLEGLL